MGVGGTGRSVGEIGRGWAVGEDHRPKLVGPGDPSAGEWPCLCDAFLVCAPEGTK